MFGSYCVIPDVPALKVQVQRVDDRVAVSVRGARPIRPPGDRLELGVGA